MNAFAITHPQGDLPLRRRPDGGRRRARLLPALAPVPADRAVRAAGRGRGRGPARRRAASRRPTSAVVLSHLHTDHVGGLAPFAGARCWSSPPSGGARPASRGRLRGYLPAGVAGRSRPRLLGFPGPPIGPFPACATCSATARCCSCRCRGTRPATSACSRQDAGGRALIAGDAVTGADRAEGGGAGRGGLLSTERRDRADGARRQRRTELVERRGRGHGRPAQAR